MVALTRFKACLSRFYGKQEHTHGMNEHLTGSVEVRGSIPLGSTKNLSKI